MANSRSTVLADAFIASDVGIASFARQVTLVAIAVLFVTAAAYIRIPMWPVPITMQTFAVLVVGVAYGPTLAGASLLAYLALGAAGIAVFTGDGTAQGGLAYMTGPTGGYLVGFLVAAVVVGWLARKGWDRSFMRMAAAMLAGNAIIYLFGLSWMTTLFAEEKGMMWVVLWGMVNFLPGDLLKLVLATVIVPFTRAALKR